MQKILFSTPMQIEHVRIGREFSYYIRTTIDKLFPTSNILLKMSEQIVRVYHNKFQFNIRSYIYVRFGRCLVEILFS